MGPPGDAVPAGDLWSAADIWDYAGGSGASRAICAATNAGSGTCAEGGRSCADARTDATASDNTGCRGGTCTAADNDDAPDRRAPRGASARFHHICNHNIAPAADHTPGATSGGHDDWWWLRKRTRVEQALL